jgi:hypothetical protein
MPVMITNEDGEPLGLDYPEYDSDYEYDDFEDYGDEEPECEGHESLDGAHMGETVYCDGSCQL